MSLSKERKEELKKRVLDESVFGPMVDKTFQDADLNNNGVIEKSELATLLKTIYGTFGLDGPTDEEVKDELKRLDQNCDGKINKEEFRTLVKELTLFSIDNQ